MAEIDLRRGDNETLLNRAAEWITDWSVGKHQFSLSVIKSQVGAACIAGGVALYATDPSIVSPFLALALVLLWCGIIFSPKARPQWPILVPVLVIAASSLAVIPFALNLAPTLLMAILTLSLAPLVLVRNPYIWRWLTPVWVFHASLAFWQWFALHEVRVAGITGNANSAAVFLLIGSVYLLNGKSRLRWAMLPLIMAILFTGSRWTVVVASITLLAIFALKYVNWRYIAVGVGVGIILTTGITWPSADQTWLRPNTAKIHLVGEQTGASNAGISPIWMPRGFYDSGIHNVPWRMMHETGILSGLAWVVAGIYSLARKPDLRWWMFLVVALASLMYYNTWIGPLGAFWWLLVTPLNNKREDQHH